MTPSFRQISSEPERASGLWNTFSSPVQNGTSADPATHADRVGIHLPTRWTPARILILSGLILGISYTGYRLTLRYQVKQRLNAFAQADYPATLEELKKWRSTPATEDESHALAQFA